MCSVWVQIVYYWLLELAGDGFGRKAGEPISALIEACSVWR